MPETGPRHLEPTVSPFDANGNFRDGGIRDFLNGTDTTDFIDSLHIATAPASSGRGLSAVRTALYSIPAVVGMGAGAVLGVGGYHVENASAGFDACELKDGVVDPFPQVTVPLGYHLEGNNCVKDATPPSTGTPNGNDRTPEPTPHDVATATPTTIFDACVYKDGVVDPFPQVTVPLGYHLEGNNCVKDATPPPTGTPNGNDKSPTPVPHDTATPTPTATATPTRTPETPTATATPTLTATPTGTPVECVGLLKIKKFEDVDRSMTITVGDKKMVWDFNVDYLANGIGADFSMTTDVNGVAVQTVKGGDYRIAEIPRAGWEETTGHPVQDVRVECGRVAPERVFLNAPIPAGETPVPTATPTRPAATPVVSKAGSGLAPDVTTTRGKFNFVAFAISTLAGISGSGMLFGRAIGRRKEEKAA